MNLLTAADIQQLPETRNQHQFNDKAIRHAKSLGDLTSLTQCGVHLVRVAPGDETTQHHRHHYCDEFIYIIAGQGTAYIDNDVYAIAAGDFMGFPAKGAAHSMKNTGTEDLLYLMGGDRVKVDVCDYPNI